MEEKTTTGLWYRQDGKPARLRLMAYHFTGSRHIGLSRLACCAADYFDTPLCQFAGCQCTDPQPHMAMGEHDGN